MESKKIEISGRKFKLNKIPAFQAQKIAFSCITALKDKDLSKIPDDILWKLLSYIEYDNGMGGTVSLDNEDVVALNVPDAGVLMTLELNALEYNFGFFFDGSLFGQLTELVERLTGAVKSADAEKAE
jgi:hypothetical protein